MAKTNYQIFNEANAPARTFNDAEYKEATQRQNGVIPGMANSRMHNKMFRQWSVMCRAIANLIVKYGYDCMDNNVTAITEKLNEIILKSSDGVNKKLDGKVSKNGDTMTGALTLPRLNFAYNSGFEMNKDGVVEITNGGSLYTAGKITAIGGFEGDVTGTADNTVKFVGKTFEQVKEDIGRGKANTNSPALTGTPTAPTAAKGTNTGQIATTEFVSTAVADLVGSSAAMLKTLRDLTTALGNDSNFAANINKMIAAKVSKSGDTMTGNLTLPRLNFGYDSGFEMNKNGLIEITNGGSLYTAGKITAVGGFEGDLAGTADNATKFAGKTFEQIKNEFDLKMTNALSGKLSKTERAADSAKLENRTLQQVLDEAKNRAPKLSILTGTIAHGGTLPLPSGYSESQCKWMVSPAKIIDYATGDDLHHFSCTVDAQRKVSCLAENSGDTTGANTLANYIVIGVK